MPCSIVIPTKDRPTGLLQAVTSALEGLPVGGEIIVVDDACRTPASEVLGHLVSETLRVVCNPGPHGPSQARNHGVKAARRPVIFFLDDDDVILPDYCSSILGRIGSLPQDSGYGFSAAFIKRPNGPDLYEGKSIDSGMLPDDTPLDERLTGLGTGFWIERSLFEKVGGLDPALDVNEDTEFAIRLAAAGIRGYYHNQPGVVIFHDPVRAANDRKSITRGADAMKRAMGFEYILRKHDAFLKDHGAFRRKFMFRVIKYRRRAEKTEGWTAFCRSLRPTVENRLIWALGLVWLSAAIPLRRLQSSRPNA